jgi:hypothetical protein
MHHRISSLTLSLTASLALSCGGDTGVVKLASPPSVSITSPNCDAPDEDDYAPLVAGTIVGFSGLVEDAGQTPWDELKVTWKSDNIAVCAGGSADDNTGATACEIDVPDDGSETMTISLHARDSDGDVGNDPKKCDIINDAPPVVVIEDISNESEREEGVCFGDDLRLSARITDDVDPSPELTVEWTINGELQEGDLVTPDGEGQSIIRYSVAGDSNLVVVVRAYDSSGGEGRDDDLVNVGECGMYPDPCVIIDPYDDDVFYLGDTVRFLALIDDVEDGPQGLTLTWSTDQPEGDLGESNGGADGETTFATSDFVTEGTHLVTLTCLDSDGNQVTDDVLIELEDCMRDWFPDFDGDGYGDGDDPDLVVTDCAGPSGYIDNDADCDDTDATVYPTATEQCDNIDHDCDGSTSNGVTFTDWYPDVDSDGYGDSVGIPVNDCVSPTGYVADNTDCDDTDATLNTSATEVCDDIDNDCDGYIDDDDSSLDLSTATSWYVDSDADGYGDSSASTLACLQPSGYVADATDCDDAAVAVNPAASEVCNSIDDDCDTLVDAADSSVDVSTGSTWYTDADGDGYGDPASPVWDCAQPSGTVTDDTDCDDTDSAVNPGATEICSGQDEDCDGYVDADDPSVDTTTLLTWYADGDADGYGDASDSTTACSQPTGYVSDDQDCDDGDSSISPAATEICDAAATDEDCDGLSDDADSSVSTSSQSTWYADSDSDGYGDAGSAVLACDSPSAHVSDDADCDDGDSAVNPAASEVCNSVDDDCDTLVDDDDASVDLSTGSTWYTDADGDGYGDPGSPVSACVQPTGTVTDDTDCDDTDAAVNPGATEICSGRDEDCDGYVDADDPSVDTTTLATWYADDDADGYGDASDSTTACSQPTGYVSDDQDCDDGNSSISPAATEICDAGSTDEDCDGLADDADSSVSTSSQSTWYADGDSDGYGDAGSTTLACDRPSGYVSDDSDCDDSDSGVNPGANEVCDAANEDEDCDGLADNDDPSAASSGKTRYYSDSDSDGYGSSSSGGTLYCDDPGTGALTDNSDCNDSNASINPGATEVCDSSNTDEDCDGYADDADSSATGQSTWYQDSDADGYTLTSPTTSACDEPSGYSTYTSSADCDDSSSSIYPGATEVCDSVDNDCDGSIDESVTTTYYLDADGDGYGDSSTTMEACSRPSGYASSSSDCDDSDSSIRPGATEACDYVDNDCDGTVDEGGCADIEVTNVSASVGSSTTTVTATLRNNGTVTASGFTVGARAGTSSSYSSNSTFGSSCSKSLSAGSSTTCSFSDSNPTGSSTITSSTIYFHAYANYSGSLGETDYTNNTDYDTASVCSATNYWERTTGATSMTKTVSGTGSGHGGARLRVEWEDDGGGGIDFRVCKTSGTFSQDIYAYFMEGVKYTFWYGMVNRSLSASGRTCTAWTSAGSTSTWSEGEGYGGNMQVVSPSSSFSTWSSGTCSSTVGTGGCWLAASSILYRTCL